MQQCAVNFHREDRVLQHTIVKWVLLVGKVFGLKVFKNGTYKILSDALYRTYEYIAQGQPSHS